MANTKEGNLNSYCHFFPPLLKKLPSQFLMQKHVHCVTCAGNFFSQASLHNVALWL